MDLLSKSIGELEWQIEHEDEISQIGSNALDSMQNLQIHVGIFVI